MNADRLRQIEELFHAVREGSAEQQATLLARADPELRREVESLLARQSDELLLDRPVVEAATRLTDDQDPPPLAPGTLLGPYRVERKLGEGGMGDVFRAVDTRLGRAVAIKTTREQFSGRFEREARAISSLNHPNICTLYDIGPNYLVMELVEGETIAARLTSGPLPIDTALIYGAQIAAALAEAHAKGVIHRDLKPANVMIGRSGIKVLDFGIATLAVDETITARRVVMGTPAYMAPEQRQGRRADARSDIYSFGCVLYEMLTGVRPFQRRRLPSRTLESIVGRCLEENPDDRWQSIGGLASELSAVATTRHGSVRTKSDSSCRAQSGRARMVTQRRAIVLADFSNATGDAAFDGTLHQILSVQLEDSPHLSLLSDARVSQTLRLMHRPVDARLTPNLAAEICERTASAAVIEGSITSLGNSYVLSIRVRDCRTGGILDKEQASARTRDDVPKALARVAKRFGSRAAESLPEVKTEASFSVEATTAFLEAWRSYSAAMKAGRNTGQSTERISLLKRAIEIDPTFAMAHAHLGRNLSDLGETTLGAQSIARAYELRDRVSDRENYFITFGYHRQVTRNLELARQTLESWTQKYPRDLYPHAFLSGFTSPGLGDYDRAIEEGLEAIELDPGFAIGYFNVAWVYVYLNRLADADALLQKAAEHQIEVFQFSLVRYALAFLRSDKPAMLREAAQRQTRLHAQGWFEHQEALTAAYHGRLIDAERLSEQAVLRARQGGLPERAALFLGARAVWHALFGNHEKGWRAASAALSLSRSRDADYGPGLALAILRESVQAREIQEALTTGYPQDTSVQFSYLPTLRAIDALNENDAARALEITQVAAPYDLAVPATAYFTGPFFGALYPVYVRGLAYLRLDRPLEAVGEFEKLLNHPGLVLNDPIGPMARLQLARALSAAAHTARAAAAYEHFLTLWKDADADIPILEQARAERAACA